MLTLIEVLAVLVVLFLAAAVATQERAVLVDVPADAPDLELPAAGLQPEDVTAVRFQMALRGYRMQEVDEVLDRLARELAARDERMAALEQALVEVAEPHVQELESRDTFQQPPWPQPELEPEPESESPAPVPVVAEEPAIAVGTQEVVAPAPAPEAIPLPDAAPEQDGTPRDPA